MKIETKYDIGQEVFVSVYRHLYKTRIVKCLGKSYKVAGIPTSSIGAKVIYPTKEACEHAIKEMEDGNN